MVKDKDKGEEFKVKEAEIQEQTKEDNNEMENIRDPYNELQKNPWDKEP